MAAAQAHWRDRHAGGLRADAAAARVRPEPPARGGVAAARAEDDLLGDLVRRPGGGAGVVRQRLLPRQRDAGRGDASSTGRPPGWGGSSASRRARWAGRRYRVLAFGADAIPGVDADVLEVDREPWAGGGAEGAEPLAGRPRACARARPRRAVLRVRGRARDRRRAAGLIDGADRPPDAVSRRARQLLAPPRRPAHARRRRARTRRRRSPRSRRGSRRTASGSRTSSC